MNNSIKIYDMIIIGGGPGGYTAALYGARAGLSTLVLEKLSAGGQMALTTQIDNYPGFDEGIDGFTLGEKMQAGAEKFGAVSELADVYSLKLNEEVKEVETSEGTFYGRTVVIATGSTPKNLGLDGEISMVGRGVNYCAACDGMFYKDKTVAVVGGGNTAVADAQILSRICKKVYIIHRRDTLRAEKASYQSLLNAENVEFIWNSAVEEFIADSKLTGIKLKNLQTEEISQLNIDGLFVSIGRNPESSLAADQLQLDATGYIMADETTKTNLPGVFAVGDVRTKPLRQVVTAVADGAMAVHFAVEYLSEIEIIHA